MKKKVFYILKYNRIILIFLLFFTVFLNLNLECPPPILETICFDFEESDMGWKAQTYQNSQAIYSVERTVEEFFSGSHSLKMMVDLIGNDPKNGQGEAFVDLRYHSPQKELDAPVDLLGAEITAMIKAPNGSSGPSGNRNYFQVFVTDSSNGSWKSEYGKATDIIENEWFEIKLSPSRTEPQGGDMKPGFDPTKIYLLGVKIGSRADSTYKYKGPIYLDNYCITFKNN